MDYKIARFWSANNRPDNCCINLPKQYVVHHKILDNEYVIIRNTPEGILIQPLTELSNIKTEKKKDE